MPSAAAASVLFGDTLENLECFRPGTLPFTWSLSDFAQHTISEPYTPSLPRYRASSSIDAFLGAEDEMSLLFSESSASTGHA